VTVEHIRQALIVVRDNRLRSGLAALAMASAVFALAGISAGLSALEAFARTTTARTIGSDVFSLARVGSRAGLGRRELARKLERHPPIVRLEARFLERHAADRVVYAPSAQRIGDAATRFQRLDGVSITGTTASLARVRGLGIAEGRMFTDEEAVRGAAVAVIGAELRRELFPGRTAIGASLRLADRVFRVVGVQESLGQFGGQTQDRYAFVPLAAFERAFGPPASLQIFARPAVPAREGAISAGARAEDHARASLRAARRLPPAQLDNFDVVTPEAARGFVSRLAAALGAAAAPISLTALLAAFVVVTNTTLVSVAQRTREIGIRRALGARSADIRAEVVSEALIVSALGSMTGAAFVAALIAGAASFGVDVSIHPATLARSVALASLAGVVAGYFPASRASRMDVASALRSE
jgi:putative ABC transport system permease protein